MTLVQNFRGSASRLLQHPFARVISIAVILVLAAFPSLPFPWLPFPWRMPLVGLLAIALIILETGSTRSAGLRQVPVRSTLLWAVATAVIGVLVVGVALTPIVEWITGIKADYSAYGALKGNVTLASTLLAKALLSAAIGEELVYRGFLLHQLRAIFGSSGLARHASVLAGAMLFTLPHYHQGISGLISVFLMGALLGYVFFANGRNLWALIIAHGLVDSWGIFSLYQGWY